jgi:hypothetical protein
MHDPKAMTAIDAATGDLAGFESYGSDLALNQALEQKAAASDQRAHQAPEPALLEESVATSGGSADSTMPMEVGDSAADHQAEVPTEAAKRALAESRTAAAPAKLASLPICSKTITDHCTQNSAAPPEHGRK